MSCKNKSTGNPIIFGNAADQSTPPNCGNCRCSVPTDDPCQVVCVPLREYRDPNRGGDCSRYARKPAPAPYTSAFVPRK